MRRCNFCKFKCTQINKMIAHIKDEHPAEFRALSRERQTGIREAIDEAMKKDKGKGNAR